MLGVSLCLFSAILPTIWGTSLGSYCLVRPTAPHDNPKRDGLEAHVTLHHPAPTLTELLHPSRFLSLGCLACQVAENRCAFATDALHCPYTSSSAHLRLLEEPSHSIAAMLMPARRLWEGGSDYLVLMV